MRRQAIAALILFGALATAIPPVVAAVPATTAAPASSTMIEVSERFRIVAKRVLTKVIFARLKASCGADHRCQSLVGALEELVPGVTGKDSAALALAVGRFVTRYSFYLGIQSADLRLALEKLTDGPSLQAPLACQAAARALGRELVDCIPELYLGRAGACSKDVLSKLAGSCANTPLVATLKASAASTGWDLVSGPRDASQWTLLAIDVESELSKRGLSTPLANFVLTGLHQLTGTSRNYFDQGLAIRGNLNARLANASGRTVTVLFPDTALEGTVRGAVARCAPSLSSALDEWTTKKDAFASAVSQRQKPEPSLRAPLEALLKTRTTPSLLEPGCPGAHWVQALAGAAEEALQTSTLAELIELPPAIGLILDVVNGRDPALSRKEALRWLVLAASERLAATRGAAMRDLPSCEVLAARLWVGDVATFPATGCVPQLSSPGDAPSGLDAGVPPDFFKKLGEGRFGPGPSLTAVGAGRYLLASPKSIDLVAAAQLVLRLWAQADTNDTMNEALLLLARGDLDDAGARVLSQAGARLFAAVRDRIERDKGRLGDHVVVIDAVIQAAFEPLTEIFSGGDRQVILNNLANQALSHALEDQSLNRTPLLVRVGLGATWTDLDGRRVALTVLDQFGLALKGGGVCEPYVGLFAGGFIDALIRTQTDGSTHNFWVTGATAGITRLSETLPLGIELHAGRALPFTDLIHGPQSWMGGVSLLVPIDLVLDGE